VRGCLGFLVVVALAGAALAVAAVNVILPAAVSVAVRDSPFLRGSDVRVEVDASLTGVFLHGSIDRITISGDGLDAPNARIASAAIVLKDVGIVDRSFASATGTLGGVDLEATGAGALHLETVTLDGSSRALTAVADLDAASAVAAIRAKFIAAGVPVDGVSLAAGRIDLSIGGRTIVATPLVTATEVRLETGAVGVSMPIVTFPTTGEWQVTAIVVTPRGVQVTALVALR
jgi:hypothetical protein